MTKQEALKHAKKAVGILRKNAVRYALKHGRVRWNGNHNTTGRLVRELGIVTSSWNARTNVKAALTRALNEAVDLGLVERMRCGYGSETVWRYVGPEVQDAIKKYEERTKQDQRQLVSDLRELGLPFREADATATHITFSLKDIRRAVKKRGGR